MHGPSIAVPLLSNSSSVPYVSSADPASGPTPAAESELRSTEFVEPSTDPVSQPTFAVVPGVEPSTAPVSDSTPAAATVLFSTQASEIFPSADGCDVPPDTPLASDTPVVGESSYLRPPIELCGPGVLFPDISDEVLAAIPLEGPIEELMELYSSYPVADEDLVPSQDSLADPAVGRLVDTLVSIAFAVNDAADDSDEDDDVEMDSSMELASDSDSEAASDLDASMDLAEEEPSDKADPLVDASRSDVSIDSPNTVPALLESSSTSVSAPVTSEHTKSVPMDVSPQSSVLSPSTLLNVESPPDDPPSTTVPVADPVASSAPELADWALSPDPSQSSTCTVVEEGSSSGELVQSLLRSVPRLPVAAHLSPAVRQASAALRDLRPPRSSLRANPWRKLNE